MNMKVVFEDVKFMRATSMQENKDILITISIHRVSGRFEIVEGRSAIAQGIIRTGENENMTEIITDQSKISVKLSQADFYKELRLRGYFHKGLFRAVTEISSDGSEGKIKWNEEWTTFIDCLIQFLVLTKNTRALVLPTNIRKLVIDPQLQLQCLRQIVGDEKLLSVQFCPKINVVKAGGVEIHEFEGSAVNRRRNQAEPVLEAQKFIPHFPTPVLSNVDMAKFCVQLAVEIEPTKKFVSVEIDSNDREPLSEFIATALSDMPVITSDIQYLSSRNYENENFSVQNSELSSFSNVTLVIKSNCLENKVFLDTVKTVTNYKGFVLSIENGNVPEIPENMNLLAVIDVGSEKVLMLQFKKQNEAEKIPEKVIQISSNVNEWLEPLKVALKSSKVIAFSSNDQLSGIVGLVNCIRKEPNGNNLRCVFIDDKTAPPFDLQSEFYFSQLSLGFPINILKNGAWGTNRHLKLDQLKTTLTQERSDHYYVDCLVKGDLSTLSWIQGPLEVTNNQDLINIQYASLNFRDIMIATGKIDLHFKLGLEFSGVTRSGRRVFGMGVCGTLSTHFDIKKSWLFDVPDGWSLEESATVSGIYGTIYLAFFVASKLESGKSILIHAGSGGIGLGAIQVALSYGLDVYTTVSTVEKKKFLLETFPNLKPDQIGNSRDTTFENMVMRGTNGRGVDYVLNSLSDEKLQASLRCLARHGIFLEIGKYDIMTKAKFDMGLYNKRIVFRPVFFDDFAYEGDELKVKTFFHF